MSVTSAQVNLPDFGPPEAFASVAGAKSEDRSPYCCITRDIPPFNSFLFNDVSSFPRVSYDVTRGFLA